MFGWFIEKFCPGNGPQWLCEACYVWQDSNPRLASCVACGAPRWTYYRCETLTSKEHVHRSPTSVCADSITAECFQLTFEAEEMVEEELLALNTNVVFICKCSRIYAKDQKQCTKCLSSTFWQLEKLFWHVLDIPQQVSKPPTKNQIQPQPHLLQQEAQEKKDPNVTVWICRLCNTRGKETCEQIKPIFCPHCGCLLLTNCQGDIAKLKEEQDKNEREKKTDPCFTPLQEQNEEELQIALGLSLSLTSVESKIFEEKSEPIQKKHRTQRVDNWQKNPNHVRETLLGEKSSKEISEDLELAIALSLSEDSNEEKKSATHLINPTRPGKSIRSTKREDMSRFFFTEDTILPPFPFWCSCKWLNSRQRQASKSGWDVTRVWCINPTCGKEREGWWICSTCTYENKLQPYDTKYNLSNEAPPSHECQVCNAKTRKITVVYKNGKEMDLLTEAFLISECKASLKASLNFARAATASNKPLNQLAVDDAETKAVRQKQLQLFCNMAKMDCVQITHMNFDNLELTPKEMVHILRKFSRNKLIDQVALWLVLHDKIPLYETNDDGSIVSYWDNLSVVLKENPLLLHVYGWIMNPKRNWFCFESLFLILMYWCSFSQGHETCLRKFVSILCTANALSEKKNT